MQIKADKDGQEAIKQLCDIALRSGGLQNAEGVMVILRSVQPLEELQETGPDTE